MSDQRGFTLIELVVVIVILGILAAVAIPKFVNMQVDAKIASVKGLEGSIRSASAIAHALALVKNQTGATGAVSIEGTNIDLVYGYPASNTTGTNGTSIGDVVTSSGFSFTAGATATFDVDADTGTDDCKVTYTAPLAVNTAPAIVVTATCD